MIAAEDRTPAVRLAKRVLLWNVIRYAWKVDESRVRCIVFEMRHDPTQFAVLHRATKHAHATGGDYAGAWQVSHFDSLGAVGDQRGDTATSALRDIDRRTYRLRTIVTL